MRGAVRVPVGGAPVVGPVRGALVGAGGALVGAMGALVGAMGTVVTWGVSNIILRVNKKRIVIISCFTIIDGGYRRAIVTRNA